MVLKAYKRAQRAVKTFCELVSNPNAKTFYPREARKSRARIICENLMWVLKHREINHFYYLWGFDRACFERPDKYLPEQAFCRMRDRANAYKQFGSHRARYICMLQDKFVFGQYLGALGFPTPCILALCDQNGIDWLDSGRWQSWERITEHEDVDGFLKDTLGRCGKSVYPVRVRKGKLLINGKETPPEVLRKEIDGKYVIQKRVIQHPEMSRIYPHSVNTIRLVTLRGPDQIQVVSGTFRMGAGGNPFDNWSSGGIGVGLNVESGRLNRIGLFRDASGGSLAAHPETKVRFEDFRIPFYKESLDLVRELHGFFYGVHSIGWDIAIAEQGPTVIEGNNSWCIGFQQIHDNTIKNKFLGSLSY